MTPARLVRSPAAWLCAALLLCVVLYAPGLSGSFLFDDFPNIVDNTDVQVTRLHWSDWKTAALSSPSQELRRPLAMLSLAANHYFTGLDARPMKLTNLLIHLANGVLLWRVLRELLGLWNRRRARPLAAATLEWAAVWIAAAWLLCPINLSPVLYVVQRMESLAQAFVLGGLLAYLRGRRAMLEGRAGLAAAGAGLVGGAALGVLCKESAALLPLYAFLLEACVLRFEPAGPDRRRLWALYAAVLLAPAAAGLAWLLPHTLTAQAYADRPFDLAQRLLTECRVLVDYAVWTLFPRPDLLGFYHDDIAVSTGWLAPPATLGCALLIAALLSAAAALRRRLGLASLGIAWYFAAHLLTATVIPLELVFEHRNYFASIGLLLAAAALFLELPGRLRLLRTAVPLLALAVFCACTALRAMQWSDPIRFAYAEAGEHPASPRANYELGRTLVVASDYRSDSSLIEPALQALQTAAALPGSGLLPDAALIIVAGHIHRAVQPQWWQALLGKLARHAPNEEDVSALHSLADCQHKGICPPDTAPLLQAFVTALGHGNPTARLLATYGGFAANQLGDYGLARNLLGDAVALAPASVEYRLEYISVLYLNGETDAALERLRVLAAGPLNRTQAGRVAELTRLVQSRGTRPPER
ncbi:MAG: hypothetical protein ISP90_14255 [Nevskia sp.]|nr:hypothetical protein [Nevskia sp.]